MTLSARLRGRRGWSDSERVRGVSQLAECEGGIDTSHSPRSVDGSSYSRFAERPCSSSPTETDAPPAIEFVGRDGISRWLVCAGLRLDGRRPRRADGHDEHLVSTVEEGSWYLEIDDIGE